MNRIDPKELADIAFQYNVIPAVLVHRPCHDGETEKERRARTWILYNSDTREIELEGLVWLCLNKPKNVLDMLTLFNEERGDNFLCCYRANKSFYGSDKYQLGLSIGWEPNKPGRMQEIIDHMYKALSPHEKKVPNIIHKINKNPYKFHIGIQDAHELALIYDIDTLYELPDRLDPSWSKK